LILRLSVFNIDRFTLGVNLMLLLSFIRPRKLVQESFPKDQFSPSARTNLINIMYIISDLSIGGAEMMLYKLLVQTDRDRFEPVVISLIDQGALRQRIAALGISVYSLGMKAGRPTPGGLWRLIRLIRRIKPDLILGCMYHSCLAAELAKIFSFRRAPVLWSIHYSISSLATEKKLTAAVIKLCGFLSRLPAKIIYVSHAGQSQHEPLGFRTENSCVIPNGIDVEEFTPSAQARFSVREELGIPAGALLIGLTGRYHPIKDHATFLRAAALHSKTYPQTHFVLIGRQVDEQNQELCDSIREMGLADRAHLLGERHDTARLAASLDIFSLSSWGESCPNVIGEAMACGVPCVVTDVGDAAWIVGETGQVIPTRDPTALAAAWKKMIDLGPAKRQALGLLARLRVIDSFPVQLTIARYENLYATALAGNAPEESAITGGWTNRRLEPGT
jgi:glycosyltransferase involved in cell wall biosynthesis